MKILKLTLIINLFFIIISNISFASDCGPKIDKLAYENGIKIYCSLSGFATDDDNISGEIADVRLLNDISLYLNSFIVAYPKPFISDNMKKIVILKDLKYKGTKVGGLSNGSSIYLNAKRFSQPLMQKIYVRDLHHEFSSNIFKKLVNIVDKRRWSKISAIYYDYSEEYENKCLSDSDFSFDSNETLFEMGFLSNYGRTTEENDFNVYAERIFTNDEVIYRAINYSAKVRNKIEIFKAMYKNAGYDRDFPAKI